MHAGMSDLKIALQDLSTQRFNLIHPLDASGENKTAASEAGCGVVRVTY